MTGGRSSANNNPSFNELLFGKCKSLKVNGKPIKSRDIQGKINQRELPALPPSKVNQNMMCLVWHTKAMCNANCPRAAVPVDYTNSKIPYVSHRKRPPPAEYNISTPKSKRSDMMEAQKVPVELSEYIERDVALLQRLGWTEFTRQRHRRSNLAHLHNVHHAA